MVQYYKVTLEDERIVYYAVYSNRKAVLWNKRLIPSLAEIIVE